MAATIFIALIYFLMFYGVIRISLLFRKSRNITIYLGSDERESYLIRETVYWNI